MDRRSTRLDPPGILRRLVPVVLILRIAQRVKSSMKRESGGRSFRLGPSSCTPQRDLGQPRRDQSRTELFLHSQPKRVAVLLLYSQSCPGRIGGRGVHYIFTIRGVVSEPRDVSSSWRATVYSTGPNAALCGRWQSLRLSPP